LILGARAAKSEGERNEVVGRRAMKKGRVIAIGVLIFVILVVAGAAYAFYKEPSEASLARKRKAYVESHGSLSGEIREAILVGELVVGMTFEEARASIVATGFGLTDRMKLVRESAGGGSKRIEIWSDYRHYLLGFEDGKLERITSLSAGSKQIPRDSD
jgi:hypothetical protein